MSACIDAKKATCKTCCMKKTCERIWYKLVHFCCVFNDLSFWNYNVNGRFCCCSGLASLSVTQSTFWMVMNRNGIVCSYVLNLLNIYILIYITGSQQLKALPVLSHPNRPSWPVSIPRPGANSVPRLTMPTRSPHAQRGWAAWQGHLPRTRFQITGTIMRANTVNMLVLCKCPLCTSKSLGLSKSHTTLWLNVNSSMFRMGRSLVWRLLSAISEIIIFLL